jgi:LacI family transcriptional regulator
MGEKINMGDIAKALGISKVSVSKALNGKEGVSDDLRVRIKETAETMGYRLNNSARSLRTDRQHNVGILVSEKFILDKEAYYFTVCGEMIRRLDELGYSGIMEIVTYQNEDECTLPRVYNENKVDGIIVLGQMKGGYLEKIESVTVPIVFFDFYVNHTKVDCIISDNFFTAYQLTNRLVALGHRSIAYVGSIRSTSSIQDRFLGCYKSLIENGIPLPSDCVIEDRDVQGRFIPLVLPSPLPSAFVCNCDRVAHALILTLKAEGVSVPENVSVVGFDNSIFSTISDPQITTVDNNVEEMVRTCVRIITKKIADPERVYGRVMVSGTIIERASAIAVDAK